MNDVIKIDITISSDIVARRFNNGVLVLAFKAYINFLQYSRSI